MTCRPDQLGLKESAKYWRADDVGDVELLHARYVAHAFARHTHDGAAIGVIEEGAERFYYRGAEHVATVGQTVVFNPTEVHTGQGADSFGWRFRIFYLDPALLQRASSEAVGRPQDVPFFASPIIDDVRIGKLLRDLHIRLESSESTLERQSQFIWTFAQLAERHADDPARPRAVGSEHSAVKLVKHYLEEHSAANVSLDQLAQLTQLSSYHLIRVFRSQVGLPPHAYLEQVRIDRAKRMLRAGHTLLDTALATGFTDQSHFNRHFKRLTGVTPGIYAGSAITYKTRVVGVRKTPS
jgi:AraC-like DNA-binding protein